MKTIVKVRSNAPVLPKKTKHVIVYRMSSKRPIADYINTANAQESHGRFLLQKYEQENKRSSNFWLVDRATEMRWYATQMLLAAHENRKSAQILQIKFQVKRLERKM